MNQVIISIVLTINLVVLNCLVGFAMYAFKAQTPSFKAQNIQIIDNIENYNEAKEALRSLKGAALKERDAIMQDPKVVEGKLVSVKKAEENPSNENNQSLNNKPKLSDENTANKEEEKSSYEDLLLQDAGVKK